MTFLRLVVSNTFTESSFKSRFRRAIAFMMLSVMCYGIHDTFVKLLPEEIEEPQIVFFRGLFAFLPIAVIASFEGRRHLFFSQNYTLLFIRSLFSVLALICFIAAFRLIPLANAYALTFSCPLFMAVLCIPLLGERVPFPRWIAVTFGFLGVMIVSNPGSNTLELGGIIALLGGFFYAISLVLGRKLSQTDSNTLIVGAFTLLSVVISGALLPFYWTNIDLSTYGMLIIIGILGGCAQCAMTQAFRLAPVSAIAPFDYAALLWAVGFDYFLWNVFPETITLIGVGTIVVSGLYLMASEKHADEKKTGSQAESSQKAA